MDRAGDFNALSFRTPESRTGGLHRCKALWCRPSAPNPLTFRWPLLSLQVWISYHSLPAFQVLLISCPSPINHWQLPNLSLTACPTCPSTLPPTKVPSQCHSLAWTHLCPEAPPYQECQHHLLRSRSPRLSLPVSLCHSQTLGSLLPAPYVSFLSTPCYS